MNKEIIDEIISNPEPYRVPLLVSLKRFIKVFHYYLYNKDFVFKPFHDVVINKLEDIAFGRTEKKNLIINIPVRSGKTQIIRYFLAWTFALNRASNCILVSYGYQLAMRSSQEVKDLVKSELFNKLFLLKLDNTTTSKDLWKIVDGGEMRASSMGGVITGFGVGGINTSEYAGALIIDDPIKADDYKSLTEKDNCWDYYVNTLKSRLNNPNAPIILIMQRLAKDDLTGRLLEQEGEDWELIKIPALDENDNSYWEEKTSSEYLKKLKLVHPYTFYAQYQQEPIVMGGAVIKREWFDYYNPNNNFKYKRLIITADTAMKVSEHNDYSVFIVSGITDDNKLHIVDMKRGKWEAPDLKKIAVELFEKYRFDAKTALCCSGLYIEDKASGVGLIQELQRAGIPVIGIPIERDKLARVEGVLNYIASGQVLLPYDENHGFNPEILNECEAFTRDDSHQNDDIVDTLVYAIQEGLAKGEVSLLDYFME